jgi:hypothetical protein
MEMPEIRTQQIMYLGDSESCPSWVEESFKRWAENGIEPGGFLTACLMNNLSDALGKADYTSLAYIKPIVMYMYNRLPSHCWGSREKVIAWQLYQKKRANNVDESTSLNDLWREAYDEVMERGDGTMTRKSTRNAANRRRVMGMENGDIFDRIEHNMKLVDMHLNEAVDASECNDFTQSLLNVAGCFTVIAGDLSNSIYVGPDEFIEGKVIPWLQSHGFGTNNE